MVMVGVAVPMPADTTMPAESMMLVLADVPVMSTSATESLTSTTFTLKDADEFSGMYWAVGTPAANEIVGGICAGCKIMLNVWAAEEFWLGELPGPLSFA